MSTGKLLLLRHGQSIWNLENLFTGWVDVDLTDQGRRKRRKPADCSRPKASRSTSRSPRC